MYDLARTVLAGLASTASPKRGIMRIAPLLGLCLLLLGAAAPLPALAQSRADPLTDPQARLLKPVPGKAVIYLLRDWGNWWQRDVPLSLDGQPMGSSRKDTYFRWEVEPGPHVLVSEANPPAVLEIKTEPGGVYYVWQDLNPGFLRGPSELHLVDETTARETLLTAEMLESR